jgi:hypothetical protein
MVYPGPGTMRLGILGPANGDLIGLARAAQLLVDEAHAEKVIYVADDGALERVVINWASEIIGANPSGEALFKRAAARCAKASHQEIDQFVEGERARLRLAVFVSLPGGGRRTIEILDGRVVLFVYDKGILNEEDIVAAQLLVFGKAREPLIRRVGARLFVTPGPVGCPTGGAVVLDDGADGIRVEILGPGGAVTARDHLGGPRPGKLRVQGEGG